MNKYVADTLTRAGVSFIVRRHAELSMPVHSPLDFATQLGYQLERITKTLFLRSSDKTRYVLLVCSVNKKADMARVANYLGCGRLEVASAEELAQKLGYPARGVSPINSSGFSVLIDESLFNFPSILIGAGEVGVEIEIAPATLKEITAAITLAFARA